MTKTIEQTVSMLEMLPIQEQNLDIAEWFITIPVKMISLGFLIAKVVKRICVDEWDLILKPEREAENEMFYLWQ